MLLKDQIKQEMLSALKTGAKTAHLARQLLLGEIHNAEMQKQKALTDEEIWPIIRQQIKQREESVAAYQAGNRGDLVAKERAEITVLSKYLPQEMSPIELEKVVKDVITGSGFAGQKDFGKVMGAVMAEVKGKIDGSRVSEEVKKQLT